MEMHDQENLSDFIRSLCKSRFWWATPTPRMFIGVHLGVGKGGASMIKKIFHKVFTKAGFGGQRLLLGCSLVFI